MANVIGKNSTLQIGVQSVYGTPVAPQVEFKMLSESMNEKVEYKQSDALVGKRGTDDRIIASKRTEGSVSIYPCPHSVGYLLYSFFGKQAASAQVDSSAAYDHVFTFAGQNDTLAPLSVYVDRVQNDFGFQDVYVNSITFNLTLGDYVTADIELVGKKEIAGQSQSITMSVPTTKAFFYKHGSFKFDGVATVDITSATIKLENNLKTDRRAFTTTDIEYFLAPTLGEAKVTYDFEFFYNTATEALRTGKYKTDTAMDVEITLTHDEEVEVGYPYELTFKTALGTMTNFESNVSGPDEIMASATVEGEEDDSNPIVEVTLRDARSTDYSA
jgi:hypothetical protein